jgi:hypothetical protein
LGLKKIMKMLYEDAGKYLGFLVLNFEAVGAIYP